MSLDRAKLYVKIDIKVGNCSNQSPLACSIIGLQPIKTRAELDSSTHDRASRSTRRHMAM